MNNHPIQMRDAESAVPHATTPAVPNGTTPAVPHRTIPAAPHGTTPALPQRTRRVRLSLTKPAVLLGALALFLIAGCDFFSSSSSNTVALGDPVEIEEGTTMRLGRTAYLLKFEQVTEDSRCPQNVVCVWAGIAKAEFRLVSRGTDTTFTLSIPGLVETPYEENDVVRIGDIRFELLALNPYPVHGESEEPHPYRAMIRVE